MKMNGVSATETMDTLFFQAAGRVSSGHESDSFQSVLATSRADTAERKELSYSSEVKKDVTGKDSQAVEQTTNQPAAASASSKTGEEQKASASGDQNMNQDVTGKSDGDKSQNTVPVSSDGKTNEEMKDDVISQEIISVISITIRQVVIEGMNITDEQFEEALKACGLDELQLLEPQNLKEFMLSMTDTKDITEFLTDESLIETYQMLETALSELTPDEFGIRAESLKEFMEAAEHAVLKQDVADGDVSNMNGTYVSAEPSTEQKTGQDNDPFADKLVVEDQRANVETTEQMNQKEDQPENRNDSKESILHHAAKEHSQEVPNVTEQFATQLAEHSTTVTRTGTETIVMYRQIITQIVEQVKVIIRPDQTSMSMQLQPENLGKVLFHVTAKQGAVTAQFVVENELAREAIEANMEVLKQTLQEQGTKVEAVEVTVSEFGLNERGMQQEMEEREEEKEDGTKQSGRRQFRLDELEESEDLSEEEEAIANAMIQSGSTVEFRA